jgi:WD40 repeat protein/serine/threonine protein kinase
MLETTREKSHHPAPAPAHREVTVGSGSLVDHFKIIRQVGRGGMGEVFLARDTLLGRKVALKVVRRRLRSDKGAERFLHEARTTARFSHPHIVTIYAVGQYDGYPYLALEFLEGQSLRDRINEGRISVKEAMRIGIAVADALAEAHSHKVLHRDLKPENVVIPQDGRLRVVDFGLAQVTQTIDEMETMRDGEALALPQDEIRRGVLVGTPAYMAPEHWAQREPGEAADIWALGVILFELATGRRPFDTSSVREIVTMVSGREPAPSLNTIDGIPPPFAALVARCLDKEAERRPYAAEVADTLREMLTTARRRPAAEYPFRGLQSYGERHAHLFFGRDAEVDAFLERVREVPVLPVVGPSGAGKSSFVQAGVIPRLKEQESWVVVKLRPGPRPFKTLASRLCADESLSGELTQSLPFLHSDGSQPSTPDDLERQLTATPKLLSLLLEWVATIHDTRVLLFVDQLEEVFTLGQSELTARRFLEAICSAADDAEQPTRVIFTLREDFLGRLAGTPGVRHALSEVTLVAPPGPEMLEEILVEPVKAFNHRFEDQSLVDEMVGAAGNEASSLPLLQFTAHQLWERRDRTRRCLTRTGYDTIGGVAGALATHADGVLEGLPASSLEVVRELLLRLVTPERTRRLVPFSHLVEGIGQEAEEIIDRLVHARLLSVRKSREHEREEAEVELAHESLISGWEQLSRWIERSREDLTFLEEVGHAAETWARRGRREDDLLHGHTLSDALSMLARCTTTVPDQVTRFLEASRRRRDRRVRHRRWLVAGVVGIALAVAAVFAVQKHQADTQRRVARTGWAEAQREAALAAMTRGDVLEARAKLRGSLETADSSLARALWWRLSRNPLVWRHRLAAGVYSAAFAPDGETVAAACQNRLVYLLDTRTKQTRTLRGFRDQVLSISYSPAGDSLAAGTWSGQVIVRDVRAPAAGAGIRLFAGHGAAVRWLAFSPDGRLLASVSLDRTVRVWDLDRGEVRRVFRPPSAALGVSFGPSGKRIATGGQDGKVRVWSLVPGQQPREHGGAKGPVSEVCFSPDGRLLAAGSTDGTIRIFRVSSSSSSGEPVALAGHRAGINRIRFSPDGRLLASASSDHTIRIWDIASGRSIKVIRGHEAGVYGLGFSPNGRWLVSGSKDHTIALWRVHLAGTTRSSSGHRGPVYDVAMSPDGRLVATGGDDAAVCVRDVETGALKRRLDGHGARVYSVAFSPNGRFLASGSADRTIRLWDLRSEHAFRVLGGHWAGVVSVAFSPDGKLLASAGRDRRIRLWDIETAAQQQVIQGQVNALIFSPDSQRLATSGRDGAIRVWNVADGREVKVLRGHRSEAMGVGFASAGRLVSSGVDGTVRLWDLESGEHQVLDRRKVRRYYLGVHPTRPLVGVPQANGDALILPLDPDGQRRLLVGHRSEVNYLQFSQDGRLVATTSDDRTVRLWDPQTGLPLWRAPVMLGSPPRVLTHQGWVEPGKTGPVAPRIGEKLRSTIEGSATTGDAVEDGKQLCLGVGDRVELWDIPGDRRLRTERVGGLRQLVATDDGCAALGAEEVHLLSAQRKTRTKIKASAVGRSRGKLLIAADRRVLVLDRGVERASYTTDDGVSALTLVGPNLVLGYSDGEISLVPKGHGRPPDLSFEKLPTTAVVRLVEGPRNTLIAAHADGSLGIWSLKNGARLDHTRLHGPAVHVRVDGGRLFAASELGDHAVIDLSAFHIDYCRLMQKIWREVPVLWRNRAATVKPPPVDHRCAR